ncbi:MAG: arabinogalactan oligomer / maltooligosaccharide transport system permease protein [Chloroflexia bacterium]|jgi:ABC-type sugar transport system permease subunit|nr:arabinogalactan oligomer / maltooligosaccharide transport system permease protein [Chloroflexia bacterium]
MQPTPSAQSSSRSGGDSGSGKEGGARGRASLPTSSLLLRILGLLFIDAVAFYFAYALFGQGQTAAGVILLIVTAILNWVFLDDRVYPWRWFSPGLLLMLLMVVYPLGFTLYTSLTNYSDGHLLSKEQVLAQLTSQYFQPENSVSYTWTAYRNPDGTFLLVFQDPQGNRLVGNEQESLKPFTGTGDLPATLSDSAGKQYQKLELTQTLQYLGTLTKLQFKSGDKEIKVGGLGRASESLQRYVHDPATDKLTDQQTGVVYTPIRGLFTAPDGKTLSPGYSVVVGLDNFVRVIGDDNIKGPFVSVFIWNLVFALLSVLLTFSVGLGMALVLNDKNLPLKGMWRSLIVIPYAIPAIISTVVWVGLLNPNYGQFSGLIASIFGHSPDWFSNGTWAKVGILLINTWLGYPYMMLICLGALQSIPTDMFEAAEIDGAPAWTQFFRLTLPLLLVAVAPLLIGSFAFNFNNFGAIEAYNRGGPPIPGAATPAGQTDILLSYTFRLAFGAGQGADYGLASAIGLFIFVLVAGLTAFNFRFTRRLENLV